MATFIRTIGHDGFAGCAGRILGSVTVEVLNGGQNAEVIIAASHARTLHKHLGYPAFSFILRLDYAKRHISGLTEKTAV